MAKKQMKSKRTKVKGGVDPTKTGSRSLQRRRWPGVASTSSTAGQGTRSEAYSRRANYLRKKHINPRQS